MRIDNSTFTNANKSATKQPVIVVEVAFDSASTDLYYFCTHDVAELSGVNVINDCVKAVSGTSQKLNPDKALSTIGSISFQALDVGLTDLQKLKLNSNLGLKGKRVRFYIGDASLVWSDFILAQTQIIESVDYKNKAYSFKCADVQRQMRTDIFELKTTAISSSLIAGSSSINVFNTSEFELVQQPDSPSGVTDAPGQKVGYLTLSNDCIVRYTGKTAASFTGCTWGVFDTKHLIEDIEKSSDAGADNAPSVTEFVYLEMPAVMLVYAVLTGSLYNNPGEFLPDHWHLGIDAQYIRTADLINIGLDWWDLSDNDAGIPAVVKGLKKTDGKQFLEEQLYLMLGAYSPIYANGELGLKRMTVIPSQGGYVRELNEDNIVSYGSLTHDMKSVINMAVLEWNYVLSREGYTRKNILPDDLSIERHGISDVKELKFKTLETSRHSYSTIKSRFDSLRDRYAGPPLRLQLSLLPSQNDLEIGDIVRVDLDHIKDYTGVDVDGHLDRNFEVQRVSTDWVSGKVSVELFGSSQNASALPPAESGSAIANSWYSSSGTEINATNFPGQVSESGGVTHVTGTINLTGNASLLHANAIYYCAQDLTVDLGATVIINNNTQIRVMGFFQNNGDIDGKGRGLSGGVGTTNQSSSSNSGNAGFLGSTISQDGISDIAEYAFSIHKNFVTIQSSSWVKSINNRPSVISGNNSTAPILNLSTTQTGLIGAPGDLRGSSGSAGGSLLRRDLGYNVSSTEGSNNYYKAPAADVWRSGANGGNSGAGLLITCRGMDIGANGKIDLSGDDGAVSTAYDAVYPGRGVYAGCGGGGYTGACYILLDGATSTAPTLNNANSIAEVGRCPVPSNGYNSVTNTGAKGNGHSPYGGDFGSANVGAQPSRVNTFESNFRIQYLTGYIESQSDTATHSDKPLSIALTEATNTPPTQAGNLSSVDVSVTPPTDSSYSYSKIYYRIQGQAGWLFAGNASHETSFTVTSDGSTYDVMARAISLLGNESADGVTGTISVIDANDIYTIEPPASLQAEEELYFTNIASNIKTRVLLSWSTVIKAVSYDIQVNMGVGWIDAKPQWALNNARLDDFELGDTDFRVRSVNGIGIKSEWSTVLNYLVQGKTAPPPDVVKMYVSDGVLSWEYNSAPLDLAGFEVRYHSGTRQTWSDAVQLHQGIVTTTTYNIANLISGTKTFLVKAIDTTGNYSESPAFVVFGLGDPILENIFRNVSYFGLNFPGTITNGAVDGNGWVVADQIGGFYNPVPNSVFYNQIDSSLFYDDEYLELTYDFEFTPDAADLPGSASVNFTIIGENSRVELDYEDNGIYSQFAGKIQNLELKAYKFRIVVPSQFAGTAPRVKEVEVVVDVPDITEFINDVPISASGTRLPITKTYRAIKAVTLTLQDSATNATTAKRVDKDTTLGPLIKLYNSSGTAVSGSIDATIGGY